MIGRQIEHGRSRSGSSSSETRGRPSRSRGDDPNAAPETAAVIGRGPASGHGRTLRPTDWRLVNAPIPPLSVAVDTVVAPEQRKALPSARNPARWWLVSRVTARRRRGRGDPRESRTRPGRGARAREGAGRADDRGSLRASAAVSFPTLPMVTLRRGVLRPPVRIIATQDMLPVGRGLLIGCVAVEADDGARLPAMDGLRPLVVMKRVPPPHASPRLRSDFPTVKDSRVQTSGTAPGDG